MGRGCGAGISDSRICSALSNPKRIWRLRNFIGSDRWICRQGIWCSWLSHPLSMVLNAGGLRFESGFVHNFCLEQMPQGLRCFIR